MPEQPEDESKEFAVCVAYDYAYPATITFQGKVYVPEPRWIPVTEELPRDGVNVLVAVRMGGGPLVTEAFHCMPVVDGWHFREEIFKRGTVTHWQAKPEPPKEDADA